jgi:hypothetical protein
MNETKQSFFYFNKSENRRHLASNLPTHWVSVSDPRFDIWIQFGPIWPQSVSLSWVGGSRSDMKLATADVVAVARVRFCRCRCCRCYTTIHHIPYTIYHIPNTIYHIPYTIYHIPYTIYNMPYTIYHTLFRCAKHHRRRQKRTHTLQ